MATNEVIFVSSKKVILDTILLFCVVWPSFYLYYLGGTFQRGFFCDDDSLRYPFHQSSLHGLWVYILCILLNIVTIALTEYLHRSAYDQRIIILGYTLPKWTYNTYCNIGIFAFGAGCGQFVTDLLKHAIGRLRPYFYYVCLPNIDCDLPTNKHRYIVDFNCTNPLYINEYQLMKEIRLSFPSGHTSFSTFCLVYFSIYLQKRMTWECSKLLKHALQLLAILIGFYAAMTRISDYQHHWSDVVAAISLGVITATITATTISTLFDDDKPKPKHMNGELGLLNGNRL